MIEAEPLGSVTPHSHQDFPPPCSLLTYTGTSLLVYMLWRRVVSASAPTKLPRTPSPTPEEFRRPPVLILLFVASPPVWFGYVVWPTPTDISFFHTTEAPAGLVWSSFLRQRGPPSPAQNFPPSVRVLPLSSSCSVLFQGALFEG